jgi:hypothetical protein
MMIHLEIGGDIICVLPHTPFLSTFYINIFGNLSNGKK